MSPVLALLGFAVCVPGLRAASVLPEPVEERRRLLVRAGPVVVLLLSASCASATTVADWLSLSDQSLQISCGLVVTAAGLVRMVTPPAPRYPREQSRWRWLLPTVFPVLLAPEAVALAGGVGVSGFEPYERFLVAAAGSLLAVGMAWLDSSRPGPGWTRALRFTVGAVVVLVGVELVISGIEEV